MQEHPNPPLFPWKQEIKLLWEDLPVLEVGRHPYWQRHIVWGREAVYANFITSSLFCYSKLKSLCFVKSSQIIYSLSKKVYKINNLPMSLFESFNYVQFSCSVVPDSATPWTTACQVSLSITISRSPPKPMSIESVMPSSHLILCHPLLLLPSIFPNIRSFQMSQPFASGGQSIGVSASASVLPMNTQDC